MICFDTAVLIWGVQGLAGTARTESDRDPMIDRTRRYVASLAGEGTRIMVPTPALAEYLRAFPSRDRRRQIELLDRHFFIAAFDLPSAYLAAGLARRVREEGAPEGLTRQAIEADLQIIATAVVHGARAIVTDEVEHCERLAAGRIRISAVPEIHEQTALDLEV
jgi:predicted nucleic acid-binding protein